MATLLRSLAILAGVAGALLATAWLAQRRLLYFPTRHGITEAERAAAGLGLAPWRDAGGRPLGWRSPHPSGASRGSALVLHGNAGSALDRGYLRDVLQGPGVPELDVYLLEYPGYGARAGAPSQRALVQAAVEAFDLLAPGGPVVVVGESLGTAVAALAAAERPGVAGLILLTPLAGAAEVARRHYPWFPTALLRDRLDARGALARCRVPAAFLVAGRDEVVFPDLGVALHDGYPGPKRLWLQPERGHNTVVYDRRDPAWGEMVGGVLAGGW